MSLLGDRPSTPAQEPARECSGFSSFLEPFLFSFHKEKKKETKRFEIKEELKLKKNWFLGFITTSLSTYKIEIKKKFSLLD
jgi:hypothetical protein